MHSYPMEEMLKKISQQWFLREPAYFALYCVQRFEPNDSMTCPFRVGRGRLEYNPKLLKDKTFNEVEQLMRIEMIRIFLKHPYERQPDGVSKPALALGSDVTISDNYNKDGSREKLPLIAPKNLELEENQHFEWYVRRIDEQLDGGPGDDKEEDDEDAESSPGSGKPGSKKTKKEIDKILEAAADQAKDKAELWQEDDLRKQEINDIIKSISSWGSIPGNIVEEIEASTKAKIDYRQIFHGFRASILSSKRKLSRMRPNRRMGFEQMGSVREFSTRLLVAVDVSGSISDENLSNFYSVINKMFKYGIEQIDCVQFDCELGTVKRLNKASRKIEVFGRGGTSFQPVFDYLGQHPEYDGLIILTDGYAPIPKISDSVRADILWVCEDQKSYDESHNWMELIGRACWMIL